MGKNIKRIGLGLLLSFLCVVTTHAQIATELFVPCYGSSGCIVDSEIEVTSGAVDPPTVPGGPGIITGDGEAIELCYTQSLHVSLGVNWHQGTQIDVGPGWEPIGAGSGVSGPGGGSSGAGNYIYYDYSDNCPGQGECGGDPGTVSNGFGWYYESGQNVQCGGSAGDGDASNNYGDFNPGGAAELEFCYEIITECDGAPGGEIDTTVDFLVYADSEMGTWNSCGCEGGAVECTIPFTIICCDQPELEGIFADADCADELTQLEVTGDTDNPDYIYDWQGPDGPGPQGVDQPVWDLPDPASPGEYTLLVIHNTPDGPCEKMFSINIFAGGDGAGFTVSDACVGAEGSVFIYPDEGSSYDGQFGGPACDPSVLGVNCGFDPITGIPYVEINQAALQANAPGAPGSAGTTANLIYSVGNSASPCFAFSTGIINFLGGPPAPSVNPQTIETCLGADWPGITVSPNDGWEYHWYQVPSFGTDQAVLATGTASLTDWPQHIDNNTPAPDGEPYLLFVTAVNQATGCPGPFTEIEIFVGACPCYDASSLVQAEGEITLCGDASTSDITSVLNDLEDSGDLDVNFEVDADPDGDGVSNNISFEYEYDGNGFDSVSALAATMLQDSNADLCNVLEAEVTIVFSCSSPEQSTDGDPAGAVTFILYPDLEEAILDGDVTVDYDSSCAPGTCLPTLDPPCLETTSLYDLTYENEDGTGEFLPYNCGTLTAAGSGTMSITFDTDDDGNGCADPVLDGIEFICTQTCSSPDVPPSDEQVCGSSSIGLSTDWEDYFSDPASVSDIVGVQYFLDYDVTSPDIPPSNEIDGSHEFALADGDECTATEIPVYVFLNCTVDANGDGVGDLVSAGSFLVIVFPDPSDWLIVEPNNDECCPALTGACLDENWFDVSNDYDTSGAVPDCSAEDMTGTIEWEVTNSYSFTSSTGDSFSPEASCTMMTYSATYDCEECAFNPLDDFPADNNYCVGDNVEIAITGLDAISIPDDATIVWDVQGFSPAENAAFDDMTSISIPAEGSTDGCNADYNVTYTVTCVENTDTDWTGTFEFFVFGDPADLVTVDQDASDECTIVLDNPCPAGQFDITWSAPESAEDSGSGTTFTAAEGESGDVEFTILHISGDVPTACSTHTITVPYDCAGCPTLNDTPTTADYCEGETATFTFDVTGGALSADFTLTFPDGSTQTETTDASGEVSFDYVVTSEGGCNEPDQEITYTIECENGDEIDNGAGSFEINVFVDAAGTIEANDCGASVTLDCPDFEVSITASSESALVGEVTDNITVDSGVDWDVEFTVTNPGAPDGCNGTVELTADEECSSVCPQNIEDTPDQPICDGDTIDLEVTFDNAGTVVWDLPTNPEGNTFSNYMVNSASGCSETQTVTYTVICEDDPDITQTGSITFEIYVEPSGTASNGGCEASVTPDCPEFELSGDCTYDALPGEVGTIICIISNPSEAPSGCDDPAEVEATYDCAANCPQNIQQTDDQEVCDGSTVDLEVTFDNDGTVVWTLPDGSMEEGNAISYLAESSSDCNDSVEISYVITCTDTPTNTSEGSITIDIFVEPFGSVEEEGECIVRVEAGCLEFEISGGNNGSDDTFTVEAPAGPDSAEFTITNPDAPSACYEITLSGEYDCQEDFVCPEFDTVTGDQVICDDDEIDFEIQVSGSDADASVTWEDANGTLSTDFSFSETFSSPDGCNDTQQVTWQLLCSDGTVIDGGNITIEIYTEPSATVDQDDAGCIASITLDCPDDGIVVTYDAGGETGNGNSFGANPGGANSTGTAVFTLTPSANAPAACSDPVDVPAPYECDGECPFGSDSTTETLCGDGDATLPEEGDLAITDINVTAVDGTFFWYLAPDNDPAGGDAPNAGTDLTADGCDPETYVFEAYVQCNPDGVDNNGDESYELVGVHTVTVYPEINDDSFTVSFDESGECPFVTIESDCPNFFVDIDGSGNSSYQVQPGPGQTIPFVTFENSFPDDCNEFASDFLASCDPLCPVCDGSQGVCEFDDNFEYCDADPSSGEDLPVLNTDFFIPSTGVDAEIGFYLDEDGDDEYVPGSLSADDNCTASETEIFILIVCQGGTEPTGASFTITVHPDPADMDVTINDNNTCMPSVTWECDGESGWTVENSLDSEGGTPDFSDVVDAGSVGFTFTNGNSDDCAPYTETANYNCSDCGGGVNDMDEQFFCESDEIAVPEFGDLTIEDPSGTLDGTTFGWYAEGTTPNDSGEFTGFSVSHGLTDKCEVDGPYTITGWVLCSEGTDNWIPVATVTWTIFPDVQEPQISMTVADNDDCEYVITAACPSDIVSPDVFGPQSPGAAEADLSVNVSSGFEDSINSDSICSNDFTLTVPACPSVGCPSSSGADTNETLCDGDSISFPQEGTDFDITDELGTMVAGSFAWYTSSGAEFTGTTATHPSGAVACNPEDLQFIASIVCDGPNGLEDIQVASHTVTVYPNLQAPTISRNDNTCTYTVNPACPDDVLDPDSFGPLEPGEPGDVVSINVSNPDNPCSSQDFQVNYDFCPGIPVGLNIPTAFSPNGDGFNDEFRIFGADLLSVEMFVYDRWGTQVFTTFTEVNEPVTGTGWNGEYKGEPAEIGVYVFYANVVFVNGDEEVRKGNITLIR